MAKIMTEIMLIDSNNDNDAQVPIFLDKECNFFFSDCSK